MLRAAAEIAELARESSSRAAYHASALELPRRRIGFDVGFISTRDAGSDEVVLTTVDIDASSVRACLARDVAGLRPETLASYVGTRAARRRSGRRRAERGFRSTGRCSCRSGPRTG
ncbi:hypothetical protein WMF38_01710 [Sorangium sp. So ce118]